MLLANRTFAEIGAGETAELRRLVAPDDLFIFAASGNHNPMHLPSADMDGDGRAENVAPGMFVASLVSAVLGTLLPGPGTLYLRQVVDFHERARAGDELLCRVVVILNSRSDSPMSRLASCAVAALHHAHRGDAR